MIHLRNYIAPPGDYGFLSRAESRGHWRVSSSLSLPRVGLGSQSRNADCGRMKTFFKAVHSNLPLQGKVTPTLLPQPGSRVNLDLQLPGSLL